MLCIDLGDDQARLVCGRFDDIDTDAEAEIAMFIRKRGLYQCHVDADRTTLDQTRDIGKGNGRVVGHPFIDGVTGAVADEK